MLGELPRGAAVQVGAYGRRDIAVDRGAHDRVYERQALGALGDRRAGERAGRVVAAGGSSPARRAVSPSVAPSPRIASAPASSGAPGPSATSRRSSSRETPSDPSVADVGAGPALGELARQRVQVVRVPARRVETLLDERGVRRRAELARRSARRRRPG